MGKKIRFPLKLAEGAEVRTLEELREHFDLQAVLEYYKNGKLLTWLEDRYLEGEAEAVRVLDNSAPDFQRRLCEVFQAEYSGDDVDLEAIERRQERLKRLRSITDDTEYIQNIDRVAFDQEELADLLDEGEEKIYLCGEHFTVPASRKGVSYVGINNPTVHISGKVPENAADLGIVFVAVTCDSLPPGIPTTDDVEGSIGDITHKKDIPAELLKDIQYRRICDFLEMDNYYLYRRRRGYDESVEWCIYDVFAKQETVLTGEIAEDLADKNRGKLKICGDEIAYCTDSTNSKGICSVDLRSLTIRTYDRIRCDAGKFALSSKYLAVFSNNSISNRQWTEDYIDIYDRQRLLHKICRIVIKRDIGFLLEGELLDANIEQVAGFYCGYTASCYINFFDDKLYFIVDAKKHVDKAGFSTPGITTVRQLICFDPDTKAYKSFEIGSKYINPFGPVAKWDKYIYLAYAEYDNTHIAILDLSNGTVEEIAQCKGFIEQISDQYMLYKGRLADNRYYPFVIELSTRKVKKLPDFIVEAGDEGNKLLLIGLRLYWSHYRHPHVSAGNYLLHEQEPVEERIDFRYDLTEDPPKLIELGS